MEINESKLEKKRRQNREWYHRHREEQRNKQKEYWKKQISSVLW